MDLVDIFRPAADAVEIVRQAVAIKAPAVWLQSGIVSAEAEKRGFSRVLEIRLSVGEYSGVVPECLREFFPHAAAGTAAEGAQLTVSTVPAEFECLDCGYTGAADRQNACCPECRGTALRMTRGREFYVDSLRVDDG